jgi:hypothetical protein
MQRGSWRAPVAKDTVEQTDIAIPNFQLALDQWFMEKSLKIKQAFMQSPFTIDQLQAVFASPLYTGFSNDGRGFNQLGPHITRCARFWVFLFALWTGMRLAET